MRGSSLGDVLSGVLAATLVAVSCSSSDLLFVESGDIVGRWEWVRSTGGIAGTTRTPATEGYEGSLRFEADGTVEWREDGELQWSTTWDLLNVGSGPLADRKVIAYGDPVFGWDEQAVEIRRDGHLILTDPCCDGFEHEYVRDGP